MIGFPHSPVSAFFALMAAQVDVRHKTGMAVDKDSAGGVIGVDTVGNVGIGNRHGGLTDLGQADVGRDKYPPHFLYGPRYVR